MTEFLEKFDGYTRQFERDLEKYCAEMNYRPAVLAESMRYSLQGGGKRLRPALFFSALDHSAAMPEKRDCSRLQIGRAHV